MGKLLSLGSNLRYPIKINRLLKKPGEEIAKQEAILEYSFQWKQVVGDPLWDNEWEQMQTTYATFDSPADGTIESWLVKEGQTIERNIEFVDVEEACAHEVQFGGLCAACMKDMTETNWASTSKDSERAQINQFHDQKFLKISQNQASKMDEELQRRLLKHRKLSLVVDLDQTIIHACVEPTVGEWQNDPTSPNYEAVKDVRRFQLDDIVRGIPTSCWYYVKLRPGLKEFLTRISEMYELHVYTMGTRAYAANIAKIVDPERKLFGDRVISRDENGSMHEKALERLFPLDTKMVVIIDDRGDVWPKNRPHLIKVHPYDFFLGIGDINSSFLPKREELPKPEVSVLKEDKADTKNALPIETTETPADATSIPNGSKPAGKEKKDEPMADVVLNPSVAEALVILSGGEQALLDEQTAEQESIIEKQLTERPLLHMQEKLDSEDDAAAEKTSNEKNGDSIHQHHRHNLLKDDDVELMYLEKHLTSVHKTFYDEYDRALQSVQGGRIAQLKPGHNKKIPLKKEAADLKIVPDIGKVMPSLKEPVFHGLTLVLSGMVPLNVEYMRYLNNFPSSQFTHDLFLEHAIVIVERKINLEHYRSEIVLQVQSFGAKVHSRISRKVTHLVCPTSKTRTQKVRQAAQYPNIKIVNQQWLFDTMSKWDRQDETSYLVDIPQHFEPNRDPHSHSGLDDTMESADDETASDSEIEESVSASQEEAQDLEGVMPTGDVSPVDDLKTFDWGSAEDELAEFLGENDSDDSDTSSIASGKSDRSNASSKGVKRNREDTEDEDSDEGSTLKKKQRISNSRTTGLKTVKTPNSAGSESSLPTPGVTGDEGGGEAVDGDDEEDPFADLENDLEAELEAELAGV